MNKTYTRSVTSTTTRTQASIELDNSNNVGTSNINTLNTDNEIVNNINFYDPTVEEIIENSNLNPSSNFITSIIEENETKTFYSF